MGKVLIYLDGIGQRFLLNIAWLPMNVTYDIVHKYIILIGNLHPEYEWTEKFMWEEKINKWNNIIM